MSLQHSHLADVLRLCRRNGLRRGLHTLGAKVARKVSRAFIGIPDYLDLVLSEERPASLEPSTSGPLRINWIVPAVGEGHGGLINVFRSIQQLEMWGHENRVYFLGNQNSALVQERIRKSYFPVAAEVAALSEGVKDCDVLIATAWHTAYAARSIGNTAGKFYFVQDLEHIFYAAGSLHEFARHTYQFGFRGITAGTWIRDVLRQEFNMECSSFGFSYDRNLYSDVGPRLYPSAKKRLLFYARPETERRGFELGLLVLGLVARKMPGTEFVLAGLPARSLDLPFPAIFPGVLPLSRLGALYRSCDAALVLSYTNLSLLPLELMACGCAVVSNDGQNVEWLLNNEACRVAKQDPHSLANAVLELLQSDQLRRQKIEAGIAFARSTDWATEIRAIESALLQVREGAPRLLQYA